MLADQDAAAESIGKTEKLLHKSDQTAHKFLADKSAQINALIAQTAALRDVIANFPDDEHKAARYCLETIKPQMQAAREVCDQLERMTDKAKWPYPTYESLVYSHHHDVRPL